MEIRMAKAASPIAGVAEVVGEMQRQLPTQQAEWLRQLQEQPETFADLERKVHGVFQQLADRVVAGLLAEATKPAEWASQSKKA
jgi:predicted translin family RNA/ssDNA-binding protein